MADKLRDQQIFEQLQTRYIGIGSADTTKQEWQENIHRDSLASYVGHPPMLQMFSVALGEPQSRVRQKFIDRMINPCGPERQKDGTAEKTENGETR